jgi:hypothetical protein
MYRLTRAYKAGSLGVLISFYEQDFLGLLQILMCVVHFEAPQPQLLERVHDAAWRTSASGVT